MFSPTKTRLPSSTPINRSRFHVWREKKLECKVDKKSAFLPCFHLFLFSPSQPHLRPAPLSPPSFPLRSTSQPDTQQPHVVAAPPLSLSLSLLCETLFPLYHRDSRSSSNNPFQRLPPLLAAVEGTTLSSSTPTASNPSTDRDSSKQHLQLKQQQPRRLNSPPLPPLAPCRPPWSDHPHAR